MALAGVIEYFQQNPCTRLKAGGNTLTLTVPAGPINDGVVDDYLRLELSSDQAAASS